MIIDTTFSDEFDSWYNSFGQSEKGRMLLDIEGISRRCLDVGGMSHAYFTEVFTDVTVDSNANAGEDISPNNYGAEIVKGVQKVEGYYLLYRYAIRRFGEARANEMLSSIVKGDVYFHDASGVGIQEVYSYFGDTTVLIDIDGNRKLIPLRCLYDMYNRSAKPGIGCEYIDLDDYLVDSVSTSVRRGKTSCYEALDVDFATKIHKINIWNGTSWIPVRRVLRHKRHNNLLCITTKDGRLTVVTEDHPVILENDVTKRASDIIVGDRLKIPEQNEIPYDPTIKVSTDIAYLLGMVTGDGHVQTDTKLSKSILNYFNGYGKSYGKTVPYDIIAWEKDSIAAYIAGLYDAEGSNMHNGDMLMFRVANMGLAVQFAELLKIIGVEYVSVHGREQRRSINGYKSSSNILYNVSFYPTQDTMEMLGKYSVKIGGIKYRKKDITHRIPTDNSVKRIVKLESKLDVFDYVYDITVDGEVFYSQGLIQHNCTSVSTTPIMLEGRPYGPLHSLPPKRADSFMAQCIEYLMDLSQQFAGAVALGDLVVNYAWYAKKEGLNDSAIVNDFQKFVHVTNNTFRVSGQCVDEDTEVLTPDGFKRYNELNMGDPIYVWNEGTLDIQTVNKVNVYDYDGPMHAYSGRDLTQIVTPNHLVLHRKNNSDEFLLTPSHDLIGMKTPLTIPIATLKYEADDYPISDNDIKLAAIILTDGSIYFGKRGSGRITITKSSERDGHDVIKKALGNIDYGIYIKKSGFIGGNDTLNYFFPFSAMPSALQEMRTRDTLPDWIYKLSRRQARLFIDTWAMFDGHVARDEYGRMKLQCDSYSIADEIQHVCVLAGYGSRVTNRRIGSNNKDTIYVVVYVRSVKSLKDKSVINYKGIVWCPTTDAGVVIFRRDGKVFISGNSPFSNISIFDMPNLKKLFEYHRYPDGSEVDYDYVMHIQKIFSEWFSKGDPVSKLPYRFPIVTMNICCDENKDVMDPEFLDFVAKANLENGCFNIYINEGNKIASCCRLVNNLERMNFRSDTFGNGGMNIGSTRVVTLNIPRLALKAKGDREKFFKGLDDALALARDLLMTHREDIIERRIGAEFLKFFNPLKWLDVRRYFSTFGIIGIYEMNKLMGMDIRSEEGEMFTLEVLRCIEEFAVKTSKETGHSFNVEEIPGESVAGKLCQKDKVIFGEDNVPFELYSNQYIPVIEDVPLPERITTTGSSWKF